MILDQFFTKEIPLDGVEIPATGLKELGSISLPDGYLGDRNARNANLFFTVKVPATNAPTKGAFRLDFTLKRGTTELGGMIKSVDLTSKKFVANRVPLDLFVPLEYKDIKVFSPDTIVISGLMNGTGAEKYLISAAVLAIGLALDLDNSSVFPSNDNRTQY